ncbi:MAG: hypothetical protein IT463_01630 [Planctomycetes bacterium]|nr:hypothetical protein [Planctomycetota bacterium]
MCEFNRRYLVALRTVLLMTLLLLAPLVRAGEDAKADYDAVLAAFKAKDHARTTELAEAFLAAHKDYQHAGAAAWMGGNSAFRAGLHARAEKLYRTLLADYPPSRDIEKGRDELVSLLSEMRKLPECIAQCEENLKAAPESPAAECWVLTVAECRFRLWEFESAEKALKAFIEAHPASPLLARARSLLDDINPPLKVGADGVVAGYDGKYRDDPRLAAALKALPGAVKAGCAMLEKMLGVKVAGKASAVFEFKDKADSRITDRATTRTIAMKYKPFTLMTFYTEHIVVSLPDFESRVAHELKHAAFRTLMGQAYLNLPEWVREGLAVYGAGQLEDRICHVVGNQVFGGQPSLAVLDGLEDADHDSTDYIEDALAFAWLEGRKAGAVKEYCRRLLAGEAHDKLFAALSGLEYAAAVEAAGTFARDEVTRRLGSAEAELISLQQAEDAAVSSGKADHWRKNTGLREYRAWLKANPAHPLAANCRYRLAKAVVLTGDYEQGRVLMAEVEADQLRTSLCDDAVYWLARSHELEGNAEAADKEYDRLLHDYSWSSAAQRLRDERARKPG